MYIHRQCRILNELTKKRIAAFFRSISDEDDGIAGYMLNQLKAEVGCQVHRSQSAGVGKFSERLKKDSTERFVGLAPFSGAGVTERDEIYIRDCMKDIVEVLLEYFSDGKRKWAMLGGSRGCGKTVVGSIIAILLAVQGRVVAYQHGSSTMLLLNENVSDEDLKILNKVLKDLGVQPLQRALQVLRVKTAEVDSFLDYFVEEGRFIFVQDIGDQPDIMVPMPAGSGNRLIVTSPNARKLRLLDKKGVAFPLIIMPPWEWHEISQLKSKLPAEVVRRRFDLIGGIPRYVVDWNEGVTEKKLEAQIKNLSLDALIYFFSAGDYMSLSSQADKDVDLIFQILPASPLDRTLSTRQEYKVVFASKEVLDRVAIKFLTLTKNEILQFTLMIDKRDGLSELKSRLLESTVHTNFGEQMKRG